jgi:hypothetical protein
MVRGTIDESERQRRWQQLADIYLSQQVYSYPPDYVTAQPSVDRLLETVERYEEDLTDQVRVHGKLHAIIQVGEAIGVDTQRTRNELVDPIMSRIEQQLQGMLNTLALESPIWRESSTASPDSELKVPTRSRVEVPLAAPSPNADTSPAH